MRVKEYSSTRILQQKNNIYRERKTRNIIFRCVFYFYDHVITSVCDDLSLENVSWWFPRQFTLQILKLHSLQTNNNNNNNKAFLHPQPSVSSLAIISILMNVDFHKCWDVQRIIKATKRPRTIHKRKDTELKTKTTKIQQKKCICHRIWVSSAKKSSSKTHRIRRWTFFCLVLSCNKIKLKKV